MGKSYKDRGEKYPKSIGGSDDDEGEFDYNEYLRQKAEEEDLQREVDEQIEIEDSLKDWHEMSDEERAELKNSQNKEQK